MGKSIARRDKENLIREHYEFQRDQLISNGKIEKSSFWNSYQITVIALDFNFRMASVAAEEKDEYSVQTLLCKSRSLIDKIDNTVRRRVNRKRYAQLYNSLYS